MHGKLDGFGRFADPWLLVLTSLSDGPKHGYAIMADVAVFSGLRMEPGTLYRALSRLERHGWVRPNGHHRTPPVLRDHRHLAGPVAVMRPVVRAVPGWRGPAAVLDRRSRYSLQLSNRY